MPSKKESICLLKLYDQFIRDSRSGRRMQPNGKKVSAGTIANYQFTRLQLQRFTEHSSFELRMRQLRKMNTSELKMQKKFWQNFYLKFTAYLYDHCGYYDNYVGANFKNIRTFFGYLNKERSFITGDFYKQFYVRKEEIAIFPLLPEELNYLIHDSAFSDSLSKRMREVKDFFVFGCTVALRFSDLVKLQRSNIRINGGHHYLVVRSKKTQTDTLVKLPSYAVTILEKYQKKKFLLPRFNIVNLNKYIKLLLEEAGFVHPVQVTRNKRGVPVEQKLSKDKPLRFCDVATTHTMRRTAITTMLSLGMPEQVVRKISGHSPTSKDFYRYVLWAQSYQDVESDKMFERLLMKKGVAESKELK